MGTASPTIESKRCTWSQVNTQNRRLWSEASPQDMIEVNSRNPPFPKKKKKTIRKAKQENQMQDLKQRFLSSFPAGSFFLLSPKWGVYSGRCRMSMCKEQLAGCQRCVCERWMCRFLRCAPLKAGRTSRWRFIRRFKASSLGANTAAPWLAAVFGHSLETPCLSLGNAHSVTRQAGPSPASSSGLLPDRVSPPLLLENSSSNDLIVPLHGQEVAFILMWRFSSSQRDQFGAGPGLRGETLQLCKHTLLLLVLLLLWCIPVFVQGMFA